VVAEIFGLDSIVVVVVAIVVLFGGSQIPKLARSLGSAQKEFKHGLREGAQEPSKDEVPEAAVVRTEPEVTHPR